MERREARVLLAEGRSAARRNQDAAPTGAPSPRTCPGRGRKKGSAGLAQAADDFARLFDIRTTGYVVISVAVVPAERVSPPPPNLYVALTPRPDLDPPSRRPDVLNRYDRPSPMAGEAEVKYLDGDFRIIRPGAFVRCAVTGVPIPLEELIYWSFDHQEAYATPEAVLARHYPDRR